MHGGCGCYQLQEPGPACLLLLVMMTVDVVPCWRPLLLLPLLNDAVVALQGCW